MKEIRNLTKEAVLISEDSSFREAIELMVKKETNSLLVVDGESKLIGEVNVSDLLDAIVPLDVDGDHIDAILGTEAEFGKAVKKAQDKLVNEFMQVDIQSVYADDTLLTIAATAIAHQTANIPIVDHENRPLGVISRRALKHILAKFLGLKDTK